MRAQKPETSYCEIRALTSAKQRFGYSPSKSSREKSTLKYFRKISDEYIHLQDDPNVVSGPDAVLCSLIPKEQHPPFRIGCYNVVILIEASRARTGSEIRCIFTCSFQNKRLPEKLNHSVY